MEVIFTDLFLNRVEQYFDRIALDDIPMAIKWSGGIFEHCEQLRNFPHSGRVVPEFGRQEIREIVHGNYRLIYEVKVNQIDMLTIWHTSQNMSDKL